MRTFPLPRLPAIAPPQTLSVEMTVGQSDYPDPSRPAPNRLFRAENVIFDTGVARVRPGVAAAYDLRGLTFTPPLLGMGTWRLAAGSPGNPKIEETGEELEFRHRLIYGRKAAGADFHGALYADLDVGFFVEVPISGVKPGLPPNGLAFFSNFNDRTYICDGFSGLIRYDGAKMLGDAAEVVLPLADLAAPVPVPLETTLFGLDYDAATNYDPALSPPFPAPPPLPLKNDGDPGGGNPSSGSNLSYSLRDTTRTDPNRDLESPFMAKGVRWQIGHDADPPQYAWAYAEVDPVLDFGKRTYPDGTANLNASPVLVLEAKLTFPEGVISGLNPQVGSPIRVLLVTSGLDHLNGVGPFPGPINETNSHEFELPVFTTFDEWHIFQFNLSAVPDDILSKVRWVVFVNRDPGTFHGLHVLFGRMAAPGYLDVPGKVWYALRHDDTEGGFGTNSPPSVSVEIADYPVGVWPEPIKKTKPIRRFGINVSFAGLGPDDTIEIYRSAVDPAVTDANGADFRKVDTITWAMASRYDPIDPRFPWVDETPEGDLPFLDSRPVPSAPPAENKDAPRFLFAGRTRMFYGPSDNHPNHLAASDLGHPESLPPILFIDNPDPGSGGHVEIGMGDGDHVVGAIYRQDEVLIFKRRRVYAWRIDAEGTLEETWNVEPLSPIGCLSPIGIRRIPGGTVWASDRGIEFMPDETNVPAPIPFTRDIQRTWDAVRKQNAHKISIEYREDIDTLYCAIPTGVATENTTTLAYSFRSRAWQGFWEPKLPPPDSTPLGAPGRFYIEWLDRDHPVTFILRNDPVMSLDRYLVPDRDEFAWYEYTIDNPVVMKLVTGWIDPAPGRNFRVTGVWVEGSTDGIPPSPTAFGDSDTFLNLRVEVRGNDALGQGALYDHTYTFHYDAIPVNDFGELRFYHPCHADLEGIAFRLTLTAAPFGLDEFRIHRFGADVQDRGGVEEENEHRRNPLLNGLITPLATVPLEDLIGEIKSRSETAVVLIHLKDEDPRTIASYVGSGTSVIGMLQSYLHFHLVRDQRLWSEGEEDL